MDYPMMQCGHVAQGVDVQGIPACVICYGIDPGATIVKELVPDLTGRIARCIQNGKEVESSYSLAFFQYRPDADYDSYYCGCRGWD